MNSINVHQAKTHLSRLIDQAVAGEPFIIAKAGKPLVKVEALEAPARPKRIGFLAGEIQVPDDFDLRFPHHENERAQSNIATNSEFVRQWVHGEHLLFDGKKMAKSSGNVLHVSDLRDRGIDPLALRLLFLENHYRTQINLTWESIEAANTTMKRWRKKIASWPRGEVANPGVNQEIINYFSNDLDSAGAILLIRRIERDDSISDGQKRAAFLAADQLLGLNLDESREIKVSTEIRGLLDLRELARRERDWVRSDELRDQLFSLGIRVSDGTEGQSWEEI